jgi:mono/diheme cytochrome c family protein
MLKSRKHPAWRTRIPTLALTLSALVMAAPGAFAADGAALYKANCASCHGADGSGDTPVAKAMKIPSIQGSSLSDNALVKFVQESDKHKMPAGKLSAEELAAIAQVVRGF